MLIPVVLSQSLLRIRRSARALARAPRLSFALLLTIALGVGSNAAIFGFLQGLTHPASPLRASDGIVSVFREDRVREAGPLSTDEYQKLKRIPGVFDWTGAARIRPADAAIDGQAQIVTVAAVTPSLASALAIPEDGAVLSQRLWQNEFEGRNLAGAAVRIDGADSRIAAVAPDRLDGLYSDQRVDLWTRSNEPDLGDSIRDGRNLWVLARLRRGASVRQARAALGSAGLEDLSIVPFTGIAPNTARGLAHVGAFLNFSAAAVFLIACINVASFLLARALRRSHETSLRIALGATRAELLRDLSADSVVLSVAGGAVGLLLGVLTAQALPAMLFAEDAARLTFAPHLFPILAASFVCVAVTALCGMMPVLGTVTDRPWMVLQRESGSPSKAIRRLQSGLVVAQISTCCMLVIATALLLDSFHSALETSAGRRLGNPILLTVQAQTRPDGPEVDPNYFRDVEQKAKSVPGLSPLAWTAQLPGSRPTWRTFRTQLASSPSRDVAMDAVWLTSGSTGLLDGKPVAGRMFASNDQGSRVAVVDEVAAAKLFGAQTVGMVIRDSADQPIEIVGVVKRRSDGAKQPRGPTIYLSALDQPGTAGPIRSGPARGATFRVPIAPPAADVELNANIVSTNYFAALGMPPIAGLTLPEHRVAGQGRVAVINEEAADLYFNGQPLGAGVIGENGVRTEIIGVVRSQVLGTFEQHAEPTIYFPVWQDTPRRMTLLVHHSQWNGAVAADFLRRMESVPGRGSAPVINTLDTRLTQSGLAPLRIATLIGGASATMALLLSILGLLSAQSDAERQRRRERALRIALGSQRWRIVFLVVKSAGRLALIGTAIGTLLSFTLSRALAADIAFVASPPVRVWLLASLIPAAVIVIASVIPARRASAISPSTILRDS